MKMAAQDLAHPLQHRIAHAYPIIGIDEGKANQVDENNNPFSIHALGHIFLLQPESLPAKVIFPDKPGIHLPLQRPVTGLASHKPQHPYRAKRIVLRPAQKAFHIQGTPPQGNGRKVVEIVSSLLVVAGKNLLQGVILFFRHKPAKTAAGKIHELLLSGALENAENLFVHRQYLFLFVPGNQKHPAGKIIHPFFAISSILHTPPPASAW